MEITNQSSFNLGVAITAISIFIALVGFSLDTKFNLRFKLRIQLMYIGLYLAIASVIATILAEFSSYFQPFLLEITGAFFILIAIIIYCFIIFFPIKTINKHNSRAFITSINDFLIKRNQSDLLKHLEDITYFYNSLLTNSIKDANLKLIFKQLFTSNLLLALFSEHPYLFEKTIHFYIKNQNNFLPTELDHIKQFINDLFVKSLNNQDSYLNSFLNEAIYPNSQSYLDELFIKNTDINYSNLFFDGIRFNNLGIDGKLSYMKMVGHYFKIIHRINMSYKNQEGYEKNVDYNDQLVKDFFGDIRSFFEMECDQGNIKLLFVALGNMAWDYTWAVRAQDKSVELRNQAGAFLYEVLHSTVSKYKVENENIFRLELHELFDKYIEMQENSSETNVAFKSFTEKLKDKITKEGFGSNAEGYYPAMIKIYFYIFSYYVFSEKCNDYDLKNLHLPILIKISESFPKLYNGFKQEFYLVKSLPVGKEEKLQREGRKTINEFLPSYISYNYKENSLTFFYSGNNFGSKILLNKVGAENKIMIEKV